MVLCRECNCGEMYVDLDKEVYHCSSCAFIEGIDVWKCDAEKRVFCNTCDAYLDYKKDVENEICVYCGNNDLDIVELSNGVY